MSTLKSSAENLTLNADGSGNDIIFQSNGSNVATLDQAGLLTATTFAGSGASLTNLPSLAGIDDQSSSNDDQLTIKDGEVVINEDSDDVDFRVESDNNTHTLFVEGSSDNVGIGYQFPEFPLTVQTDKNCITGTDVDVSEISLKIQNPNNDTDEAVGLGFGISTTTASVGGAVIFERTAGSTAGSLHFATKPSGAGATDNIPIRMTIEDNGNVEIGTMSGSGVTAGWKCAAISAGRPDVQTSATSTSARQHYFFYNPNGNVGTIVTDGSATAFNTSSDYRLKENVDYDWDATTRLKQLKPVRFNWIVDETNTLQDGFLAHEVSNIVPLAVTGEKDAVKKWESWEDLPEGISVGDNKLDDSNNTIIDGQQIDQAKLVPLLVKTIQELEARITALEA